MGLVDYSDSDSGSDPGPEPARRKPSSAPDPAPTPPGGKASAGGLPPLPEAFHDLYASTVRQSVIDDPALHQGRRRVNPHVVGNWPSHVYIEWHPTGREHDALVALVDGVQAKKPGGGPSLTSLLTSELGAPLPLHISLSRPLALATAQKDGFLEGIKAAIRGGGILPFTVTPTSLHFFKSPDSNRTFLVLNIQPKPPALPIPPRAGGPEPHPDNNNNNNNDNNPLAALLRRCNAVAARHSLPALYPRGPDGAAAVDECAFHLSLAWTLDDVAADQRARAGALLGDDGRPGPGAGVRGWEVGVGSVRVKIGNVVTRVPLGASAEGGELFG